MSLIAELRLTDAQLVMWPSVQAAPGMTLEREWATAADRASDPVLFVWASDGDFEAFEAAFPDDPTIAEYECIDSGEDRRLYRVVVNRDETTNPGPIDRQTGASRLSIETSVEGAVLKVRLPDREALTEYIRLLRENGFSVDLLRAHPANDEHGQEYDLSEKQTEALQEALRAGYFEVPRKADLETLSDRFDISEQALSERLRRGVSSVLAATVGERGEPTSGIGENATAAIDGGTGDGDDR
ncbi:MULTISPECIES: helix-turn-helix domain-containing protein [Halolamina]|uniref:Predicted DNA binding protein, contains HTH domain n=1 Tax=Halolamina pelagica TaxID=699431 RepID=A0A1I5Q1C7_9EURY|nr:MULTISPECIES: helix-turn-helix domain-containing protein [Halolamina]NHX35052.1 helix-turn-helix domain-containing protein [Halolamina sp. R1-12]SFP40025.1 Predicted DNA binding protein, contains HTH domain [Halolamina pelagica]